MAPTDDLMNLNIDEGEFLMNRKAAHDCLRVTRPSQAGRVVSEMKHLPAWRTSVSAILVWLAVTGGLPFLKAADTPIPAYLSETEAAKPLPPTLPPERFSRPEINRAYMVAKRIPPVIAQQPCFCWCSRGKHRSLLDCYVDQHAAGCEICMKEALLADQMARQGKIPAAIRAAIVRGEWRTISEEIR